MAYRWRAWVSSGASGSGERASHASARLIASSTSCRPSPVSALDVAAPAALTSRASSASSPVDGRSRSAFVRTRMIAACECCLASSAASRSAGIVSPHARITAARARYVALTSTPKRSTMSVASRRPAVSTRRNGQLGVSMTASMASRVVPGISVTIARLSPSNALKRDDFPTFGRPARTTSAPSRTSSPVRAVASNCSSARTS